MRGKVYEVKMRGAEMRMKSRTEQPDHYMPPKSSKRLTSSWLF